MSSSNNEQENMNLTLQASYAPDTTVATDDGSGDENNQEPIVPPELEDDDSASEDEADDLFFESDHTDQEGIPTDDDNDDDLDGASYVSHSFIYYASAPRGLASGGILNVYAVDVEEDDGIVFLAGSGGQGSEGNVESSDEDGSDNDDEENIGSESNAAQTSSQPNQEVDVEEDDGIVFLAGSGGQGSEGHVESSDEDGSDNDDEENIGSESNAAQTSSQPNQEDRGQRSSPRASTPIPDETVKSASDNGKSMDKKDKNNLELPKIVVTEPDQKVIEVPSLRRSLLSAANTFTIPVGINLEQVDLRPPTEELQGDDQNEIEVHSLRRSLFSTANACTIPLGIYLEQVDLSPRPQTEEREGNDPLDGYTSMDQTSGIMEGQPGSFLNYSNIQSTESGDGKVSSFIDSCNLVFTNSDESDSDSSLEADVVDEVFGIQKEAGGRSSTEVAKRPRVSKAVIKLRSILLHMAYSTYIDELTRQNGLAEVPFWLAEGFTNQWSNLSFVTTVVEGLRNKINKIQELTKSDPPNVEKFDLDWNTVNEELATLKNDALKLALEIKKKYQESGQSFMHIDDFPEWMDPSYKPFWLNVAMSFHYLEPMLEDAMLQCRNLEGRK